MSHKIFRLVSSLFLALALSFSVFTPAFAAPPANDNFADAQVITILPFTAIVDNTDATTEPDEISFCNNAHKSIWYSFTPTQNMAIRADMMGSTPSFSVVSVYISLGPGMVNLNGITCATNGFSDIFYVEAGKTYYLQADSDIGQTGILQINLEQVFPPTNDNFANAEVITSLPFSNTVNNTDATIESGEILSCGFLYKTVWYSFTPAQNMVVQVNTLGSAVLNTTSVYVSLGPGFSNLISQGCGFTDGIVEFNAEAGKTYYLRVSSNFGEAGVIQVNMDQISLSTEVTIDIKPGRFPNRIKLTQNVCNDDDNLYVAILTTPTFNARTVNASTLQLGDPNLSGKATPIKSRITDVDLDGDKDMVLRFSLCAIVTNGALNRRSTELVLIGSTLDGANFTGKDSVKVVR